MVKERKEARSERVCISLKPSTVAMLQRWSDASDIPVPTLVSNFVEESEGAFRVLIGLAEKVKAAKGEAAKRQEQSLLRTAGKKGA